MFLHEYLSQSVFGSSMHFNSIPPPGPLGPANPPRKRRRRHLTHTSTEWTRPPRRESAPHIFKDHLRTRWTGKEMHHTRKLSKEHREPANSLYTCLCHVVHRHSSQVTVGSSCPPLLFRARAKGKVGFNGHIVIREASKGHRRKPKARQSESRA